jgi:hypothetical protein
MKGAKMLNSTLKTIGRILIILILAAIVIAGLSALTSSTGQTAVQQPAFDANFAAGAQTRGPGGHEEGDSAFGMLELVKNIGIIGLVITAYWYARTWIEQSKRRIRVTA